MESGEGDGVNLVGIEGGGGESHGVRTNVFFLFLPSMTRLGCQIMSVQVNLNR